MIRLHHCHETRSMRVLWLLKEIGVDFELIVHPFDKTLRSPEYLALNPAGRVPSLELDGHVLIESGAITEVLCERFSPKRLGRPPGHAERAEWLIWVHFAETISQHSAALTQQHIALYDDAMRSPIIMRLEAKRLEKCYAAVDRRLRGRDYLVSDFTAADISVAQAIYMARHFAHITPFSDLARWYGTVTRRPAFLESLPPAGAKRLYEKDFYAAWND